MIETFSITVMPDWKNYYKAHTVRKPREQVIRAVGFCSKRDDALDLGAGTLVESNFLLESGFKRVVAVDSSEEVSVFAKGLDSKRFVLKICSYQDFEFEKNQYDLINAQYALPFNGSVNFKQFIENIKTSLRPGGIFVGQFFGVHDEWNTEGTKIVFQNKEEALDLLNGLELIEFKEEEKEAETAVGDMKHWHIFHFIARK